MTVIPATCELWVDGVRYADGSPGEPDTSAVALSGLRLVWGRQNTVDQPAPAQLTFTVADPPGGTRFDDTVRLGSKVLVWSQLGAYRMPVFAGRVTDLDAQYDDDVGAAVCDVICADDLADLANRFVGAEPWPAEMMWVRFQRVVAAAGNPIAVAPIPGPQNALIMSRMDVDRQAAQGLLLDLMTSTGTILWVMIGADGVPFLKVEDPGARPPMFVFAPDPVTGLWGPTPATAGGGGQWELPACQVLQDPVKWHRAVTDLITRVTIRYVSQTSPNTTELSVALTDPAAEVTFGARGLSVGTLLTTSNDATALAGQVLAQHQPSGAWSAAGLTWDLAVSEDAADDTLALARALLNAETRSGLPVILTGMPDWTPTDATTGLYVEGGVYSFDEGVWSLALDTASGVGIGQSMTYRQAHGEVPVCYVDIDRSVSFLDLIGVGP